MVVDVIGGGCGGWWWVGVFTHVVTREDLRRQPQAVLTFHFVRDSRISCFASTCSRLAGTQGSGGSSPPPILL